MLQDSTLQEVDEFQVCILPFRWFNDPDHLPSLPLFPHFLMFNTAGCG